MIQDDFAHRFLTKHVLINEYIVSLISNIIVLFPNVLKAISRISFIKINEIEIMKRKTSLICLYTK